MAYFDCCFTSYTLDRDVEIGVVIPSLPLPENIAGLSMGGAGVRMQVLKHPENYGAFGMFSSGANRMNMNDDCFDPENVINKKELIMPEVKARMREISEQGIPFPKAYIACGQKDCLYPCSMAWPGRNF